MNVDFQEMDWGTVVQRRVSKKPIEQGGWSIFFTYLNGTNNFDPAGQLGIRGNGDAAWFGWPTMPKLEQLRNAWLAAGDEAERRRIASLMQAQAFVDVPYLPLGAVLPADRTEPDAHRHAHGHDPVLERPAGDLRRA